MRKIIICGPTCSGKSALAIELAQKIDAVIINADSQQVYSDLPILSAQPTEAEKAQVQHYLYGAIPAENPCNVAKWLEMVSEVLQQVKNKNIIFVGGTGMYINALITGIANIPAIPDEIRNKVRNMDINQVVTELGEGAGERNLQRLRRALEVKLATGKTIQEWHASQNQKTDNSYEIFYKNVSRETLYEKINQRFIDQIERGAIEEVKNLVAKNLDFSYPCMKSHGVPEIIKYLNGKVSLADSIAKSQQNIRNYAKRQETWFRHQLPNKTIINNDSDFLKCFT